jgi:hypothetical protein
MARHARVGVGHSGIGRFGDRGVAVLAVDAQPAHVVLVAERHRLIKRQIHLREVGRV